MIDRSPSFEGLNEFGYRWDQLPVLQHEVATSDSTSPKGCVPGRKVESLPQDGVQWVNPSKCSVTAVRLKFHRSRLLDNFHPNSDRHLHGWSRAELIRGHSPSLYNLNEFGYRSEQVAVLQHEAVTSHSRSPKRRVPGRKAEYLPPDGLQWVGLLKCDMTAIELRFHHSRGRRFEYLPTGRSPALCGLKEFGYVSR